MKKQKKQNDALIDLLANASSKVLTDLIRQLAANDPGVRRECFDFLKTHVSLSDKLKKRSEGEVILALWDELLPDLHELDDYGGGNYATEDYVAELLVEIHKMLETKKVEFEYRREILEQILLYIRSGNAGLDDLLDEVAFATCYDDDDLRNLAESYEVMQDDWKIGHARGIYRKLGDRDKYLELRKSHMVYGGDYHDLATFYWEWGEKEKALQTAEKGLKKGKGRMDELRLFLAERAQESGDREKYLSLQFAHAMSRLTLEKYKAFKKMCTKAEWAVFEPKVLTQMKDTWESEQLKIRMHRREYDEAIAILLEEGYPDSMWDSTYEIQTAKKLEKRYPEEILKYYLSGLGNLKANVVRKKYAQKAKVMVKVRHLLVEVMGDPERWRVFAIKVKQDNMRRPAFQDEFGKIVPGWRDLN
ncbi:MAG: hypothetical protein K9N10_04830 [Deltaproteobacteria bacterium]|nr:hypothetical protein [Deltaproteobacteria bacterium]